MFSKSKRQVGAGGLIMQGKVIIFKANVKNFKLDGTDVTINLNAATKDISLDKLNDISSGPVMVTLEASQTELLTQESEKK